MIVITSTRTAININVTSAVIFDIKKRLTPHPVHPALSITAPWSKGVWTPHWPRVLATLGRRSLVSKIIPLVWETLFGKLFGRKILKFQFSIFEYWGMMISRHIGLGEVAMQRYDSNGFWNFNSLQNTGDVCSLSLVPSHFKQLNFIKRRCIEKWTPRIPTCGWRLA